MNSQHSRYLSNTPIVLAIFGLLFALPGLIYGGVKQAIQDTAIDMSQQTLGVDLSFMSLGDIPFFMGVVATIGAFLCCILYKKNPTLLGALAIILSIVSYLYTPSFFFLGTISMLFYLIAGVMAFQERKKLRLASVSQTALPPQIEEDVLAENTQYNNEFS